MSSPTAAGSILLTLALAAALSVDVVRDGHGVKSDEATYVAMTLSAAHDRNLSFERQDLERFWSLYQQGPEGIFLKKGKNLRVRVRAPWPFVHILNTTPEARNDRLFFGKAIIYPLAAAPLVWLFGLNGFLVLHVLLLAAVCACGYTFLAARSSPGAALIFTLAFVGASIVPVYTVFLMPEIFNLSVVFVAYFFWLYKQIVQPRGRFLSGPWSDIVAAALIGVATYSKPTHLPLVLPILVFLAWRRQFARSIVAGMVFAGVTGGLFAVNALVSGEFNYQGGDRATFYERFPFDGRQPDAWDHRQLTTTDEADVETVMAPAELAGRFGKNVLYFWVGRHFGFIPYFFPGVMALLLWMLSRDRFAAWKVLILVGFTGSALMLILLLPYTWSGGGGPPGNRYLLSAYPVLFFLLPPLGSTVPGMLAWIGGALFTAKVLINPFAAAKFTWQMTESGFARLLPVELTMANDLPVRLDTSLRARVPYGHDPTVFLYFLDRNAFPPEPPGMWIASTGRADIIVRSEHPLETLEAEVESPIQTTLTLAMGSDPVTVSLEPGRVAHVTVPARGVRGLDSYAYLMTARASNGFVPRLHDPASRDNRSLGALVRFRAIEAERVSASGETP